MSDREKLFQLVDAIPDYKLCYAITYLQGLTDGGRAELNKETLEANIPKRLKVGKFTQEKLKQ